mgnify:CR=1 FL=1
MSFQQIPDSEPALWSFGSSFFIVKRECLDHSYSLTVLLDYSAQIRRRPIGCGLQWEKKLLKMPTYIS